ncbi:MAG TPA: hypothetical protein P5186_02715 [Candidatus Paceibacterota bacterium]|nr:hypothetical protein [Candidatus Paceibacterota bacterium]HSA02538.1 hypothetical protein [Candidatus Paceibacterota bacterium]
MMTLWGSCQAAILMGWLACNSSADIIDIKLTAYQQDLQDEEIKPGSYKSTMRTIRITTKDILKMIATDAEVTLPTGAVLYLNPGDGTYEVRSKGGEVLLDVSNYFSIEEGDSVYAGTSKETDTSYSASETGYTYAKMSIEGPYTFLLGGMVSYKYSESATYSPRTDTTSGKYASSMTYTASGEGAFGDLGFAVVTGTLTGKESVSFTE